MKTFRFHSLALLAVLLFGSWTVSSEAYPPAQSAHPAEFVPSQQRSRMPSIAGRVQRSDWRIHAGDDPAWARPDWDDRTWERMGSMFDTPAHRGIFWIRFRVQSPDPADRVPTGAFITGLNAYDLYWDGVLILHNGVPGNSHRDEVSGQMDVLATMPESLTGPGAHVVAIRMSSYHHAFPGDKAWFIFFMNDPGVIQTWEMRNGIFPTLGAGAMFLLALVAVLIWSFGIRHTPLLCVGAMCLCAATAQALTALRWFYRYPADLHYGLTLSGGALHGLTAWCFLAFVITHFTVPYGRAVLLGVLPLFSLLLWLTPDAKGVWMILIAFALAMGFLVRSVRQKRTGAWPVLLGALVSSGWLLIDPWLYIWTGFLPRFFPVLLGVAVAIALWVRMERRATEQARLTATRLEIELLRKSLQPHFLMNTLTVLMEVIEQSPTLAMKLIDDLAGEFRLLAAMSAEKSVPLARELELCRTHLRLMSLRTGRDCRLEVVDTEGPANGDAWVPPALFLTLIENGFSHQCPTTGSTIFTLHCEWLPGGRMRYTFESPGEIQDPGARPQGGTGLRYIRARLEESSPGSWTFDSQATAQGWKSVIAFGFPASGPLA